MSTAVADLSAENLVRHGYIIAAVAIHETGASRGAYRGFSSPSETKAGYEIVEWLATQPWSNGQIGMVGGSYQGITQLNIAALNSPHLVAIFPDVSAFDLYEMVHPGGIYRSMLWDYWGQLRHSLDTIVPRVPVDDDTFGIELHRAATEHLQNWDPFTTFRRANFRDYDQPDFSWEKANTITQLEALNATEIPIYFSGGWNDLFAADLLFWWANYTGPKRMTMGPWSHNSKEDPAPVAKERWALSATEQHRWFDYWIKGIDNGIMNEDPFNFAVITGPEMEHIWRESPTWPPAGVADQDLYFQANGSLSNTPPDISDQFDEYLSDYTTTTGPNSRWNIFSGLQTYPDMASNDAKSLTYTSEPLTSDMDVIGFPVVTLYASSSANDGDFHVLLEMVDDQDKSTYITEGLLRSSQRKTVTAPFENYGLPYQSHKSTDVESLVLGDVYELNFYLVPTSFRFHEGDRIRVAIMAADSANTENLVFEEPPVIKMYRDQEHASKIVLPVQ